MTKVRILGIDPGLANVGYGCLEVRDGVYKCISWYDAVDAHTKSVYRAPGLYFVTAPGTPISHRLQALHEVTRNVIQRYKPDAVAMERFFGITRRPPQSADIGMGYGAIICGSMAEGIAPSTYLPNTVKKTVSSTVKADKKQVELDVRNALGLQSKIRASHVSDAFAIAITHATLGNRGRTP